jgi:hypothetical protein
MCRRTKEERERKGEREREKVIVGSNEMLESLVPLLSRDPYPSLHVFDIACE